MQEKIGKAAFWNKFVAWVAAFDSTPSEHQQAQFDTLRAEVRALNARFQIIETGVSHEQAAVCETEPKMKAC